MSEYWFKPRRYGLGATPTTWQGWAVIALYVAAICALAVWFEQDRHAHAWVFFLLVAWLTGILLFVCWKRTKGGWHWRWGDPD